jgi:peptidylprolyl isomerase
MPITLSGRARAFAALVLAGVIATGCGSSSSDVGGGTLVKDGAPCTPATAEAGTAPAAPTPAKTAPTKASHKDDTVGKGCAIDAFTYHDLEMIGVAGDGKEFINTWKDERPISTDGSDLLDALTTNLAGMKMGGVRTVSLPAADGYGADGNAEAGVAANQPLYFTVKLIGASKTRDYCRAAQPLTAFEGKPTEVPIPVKFPTEVTTKDLTVGTGRKAADGDKLEVNYVGVSCSTGAEFDTSFKEGGSPLPIATLGTGLIDGFSEGLVGIQKGGTRIIEIPAAKAYGSTGQGDIPADDNLVFFVQAVAVDAPTPATTTTAAGTATTAATGDTTATTAAETTTTAAP